MRRTAHGHGFFLCLLINMLFRFEWAMAAIAFVGVHFWLGWPLFLALIPLVIWVLYALAVTLVLSLANRAGNMQDPPRPNKNPYSKTTRDYPYEGGAEHDGI